MNKLNQIDIEYLCSSRTIETIELSSGCKTEVCYVYNYEGVYFRYFKNRTDLIGFFDDGKEIEISFGNEKDLDKFLVNKVI